MGILVIAVFYLMIVLYNYSWYWMKKQKYMYELIKKQKEDAKGKKEN